MGRIHEAEDYALGALKIRQELMGTSGDNPRIRQELADSYNNLGDLLSCSGRRDEAEEAFRSAPSSLRKVWRPTTQRPGPPPRSWPVST